MVKDPTAVSTEDKQALRPESSTLPAANKDVSRVTASVQRRTTSGATSRRAKAPTSSRNVRRPRPTFNVTARRSATLPRRAISSACPRTGGWEVAEASEMTESAERIAAEAVEMCTAKPLGMGAQGPDPLAVARHAHHPRDRGARHRARSHPRLRGQLRRHELREAVRRRQAEIRLQALQHHRRPHDRRRHRPPSATTTTA